MKTGLTAFRTALADACRAVYGDRLVSVAIFGSWARGAATPESDIDVLVVADPLPSGRGRRVAEFDAVDRATQKARSEIWPLRNVVPMLSPVIKTPADVESGSPLFLEMTENCDALVDARGFLAAYLDALRVRMARLGTRRCAAKGGYYWDYKPALRPREVVEL